MKIGKRVQARVAERSDQRVDRPRDRPPGPSAGRRPAPRPARSGCQCASHRRRASGCPRLGQYRPARSSGAGSRRVLARPSRRAGVGRNWPRCRDRPRPGSARAGGRPRGQGVTSLQLRVGLSSPGSDRERDAAGAAAADHLLEAVGPVAAPPSSAGYDQARAAEHLFDVAGRPNGMAELQQVGEPQARRAVGRLRLRRGEAGELGVGGRQEHDVGGRLAEVDRLSGIRRRSPTAPEQMHGSPSRAAPPRSRSRSRPRSPITTSRPARARPAPRRDRSSVDARRHPAATSRIGLPRTARKPLSATRRGRPIRARRRATSPLGIVERRHVDMEALEVAVLVVLVGVVMRGARIEVDLGRRAEPEHTADRHCAACARGPADAGRSSSRTRPPPPASRPRPAGRPC